MQADKKKIDKLLKTARGQLEGILKMVEEDRYCIDISTQISATEAILRKANNEIIRSHMKSCIKNAFEMGKEDEMIDELVGVIKKLK